MPTSVRAPGSLPAPLPTSTVASTDRPGRRRGSSGSSPASLIRTGTRCTTLVKLPVAFSGGSSANCAPVRGYKLSTGPRMA